MSYETMTYKAPIDGNCEIHGFYDCNMCQMSNLLAAKDAQLEAADKLAEWVGFWSNARRAKLPELILEALAAYKEARRG